MEICILYGNHNLGTMTLKSLLNISNMIYVFIDDVEFITNLGLTTLPILETTSVQFGFDAAIKYILKNGERNE